MIKHVGKHSGKKVVILFRTVPNEDHMCLVVFPETLPRHIHDDIMAALESEAGQQAKEFADYLFRVTLQDGNNALHTLHKEGMIKKIPTNQVIVTPNAKSTVRLDELNEILGKLAMGEEAVKELANLDKAAGLTGKKRPVEKNLGEVRAPKESRSTPANVDTNIKLDDILTDDQLAAQRIAQSQKMAAEAKALLAESERLQKEAASLMGATEEQHGRTKTKKTTKIKTQEA